MLLKKTHGRRTIIGGTGDVGPKAGKSFPSCFFGAKARAALALGVALWTAGGGRSEAASLFIEDAGQKVTAINGDPLATGGTVSPAVGAAASDKTLTVTGGYWYNESPLILWDIFGGQSPRNTVSGYTLILDGAVDVDEAAGGEGYHDMINNHVVLRNHSRANFVAGGFATAGDASGNSVTLIDSDAYGDVTGGWTTAGDGHTAINNTVTLINSTVERGDVMGGYVFDDADAVTGNTLNLSGANTLSWLILDGVKIGGSVQNFETINFVDLTLDPKTPVLRVTGRGVLRNFDGTKASVGKVEFSRPETIKPGDGMTLLECYKPETHDDKFPAVLELNVPDTTTQAYTLNPTAGVMVDAALKGSLALTDTALTYMATSNRATKLTFGNVEWKKEGALLDHSAVLADLPFDGADVDTTNITFTNVSLDQIQSITSSTATTLVSSFGNTVGAVTGTKYRIGTTLEGEGKASLVGNDLIFTATSKPRTTEQTHNALMGAGAGMVALSAGNDFIGDAADGLGQPGSTGADGVSAYARMGGGSTRQETGSHIDVHSWNAILALGHKNEKDKSSFEYGAFFEYGNGNYSTYNGGLRGDGSVRYTGGGLLAKWTANGGTYVEGSLRAGKLHGESNGTLWDGLGNAYKAEIDAPYWGVHLGVGREIALAGGNTLDVYGKFFLNRRNAADFEAGGQYDLDALTSKILRVGARYTMKREKWNFYGGLAYEYEMDGKATGTADGFAIRGTDPSGGSVRGELGAKLAPEDSPWSLDLNLAGFAGKKRGVTGGVSVAFMF